MLLQKKLKLFTKLYTNENLYVTFVLHTEFYLQIYIRV